MRLLCDEMLRRIARWLRAAGHDTLMLEQGARDRALYECALAQGRLLLTRDRELADFREAARCVCLLGANSTSGCVAELNRRLDIDWLHNPFSRCLHCNSELVCAAPERLHEIPRTSRVALHQAYLCPRCDQLFWEGSHVKRMREQLLTWQETGRPVASI